MRARLLLASTVLGASAIALLWACNSDDSNVPLNVYDGGSRSQLDSALPVDASGSSDAALDSALDSAADASKADSGSDAADAGAVLVNGCGPTQFAANDESAPDASRLIVFPLPDGGDLGYSPPCMRIAAGESVTWRGDFMMHPLTRQNGDPNSPIGADGGGPYDDGGPTGSLTFAFPEAGTFGYACTVHAQMLGAIQVR